MPPLFGTASRMGFNLKYYKSHVCKWSWNPIHKCIKVAYCSGFASLLAMAEWYHLSWNVSVARSSFLSRRAFSAVNLTCFRSDLWGNVVEPSWTRAASLCLSAEGTMTFSFSTKTGHFCAGRSNRGLLELWSISAVAASWAALLLLFFGPPTLWSELDGTRFCWQDTRIAFRLWKARISEVAVATCFPKPLWSAKGLLRKVAISNRVRYTAEEHKSLGYDKIKDRRRQNRRSRSKQSRPTSGDTMQRESD